MVFDFLGAFAPLGYLGGFIISLLGTAFIIPVPFQVFILPLTATLNPVLLILAVSAGATIGEYVTYFIGHYSRKFIKKIMKKEHKWIVMGEKWFHRNGFLTIFIFSATPLPMKVADIIAGYLGYSKTKFFVATFLGKIASFAAIVYFGYYSIPVLAHSLGLA